MWKHKTKWLVRGGRKVRCYLCGKRILAKGDLFLFHGDTGYYSHQSCQAESTTISGNERRRAVKKIAVGAAVVGAMAAGAGKFLDVSSQSKNSPAAQTILTSQGLIPPALTSDPANPVPGQMWYRSDAGVMAHFDGVQNRVIYSNRIVDGSAVVTSKGIVNGLSVLPNDGQDWGPDTTKGATAPGQYGGTYTVTSGIQDAVKYVFAHGGGKIFLINGIYTMQGDPTTSPSGLNTTHSYIWLPYVPNGQVYIPIEIEGEAAVSHYLNVNTESYSPPQNGVIIYQENNNDSTYQSIIAADGPATPSLNFSQIIPILRNITVRTQAGQSWIGFNFYDSGTFYGYNITADKDESASDPTMPVQQSNISDVGILLPGGGNEAGIGLFSPYVFGYYTGIQFTTHAYIEDFYMLECYEAILITSGSHANYLNGQWQWCPYGIVGSGGENPTYGILDIEDSSGSPAPSWTAPIAQFTNLVGKFLIHQVASNVGVIHNIIVQNATSVRYEFIDGYKPTPTLSANPPVSGTAYQNTNPYDIRLKIPVTYSPTSTAAATLATGTSTSSTVTTSTKVSYPAGITTGIINTYEMVVQAGQYFELVVTNATIGTVEVEAA